MKEGQRAPLFSLPSTAGTVELARLLEEGRVVLAFYYQDNTPLCAHELSFLKEVYPLVREAGAQVVAISADDLGSHRRFAQELGLPFPLASDPHLEVARAYGVAQEEEGRAQRALFLIDRDGTVIYAQPHFHPQNPAHYEGLLRALGLEL